MVEFDRIHVENGKLFTWLGNKRVENTDVEAIIAQHSRVDIEFKPVAEFPAE